MPNATVFNFSPFRVRASDLELIRGRLEEEGHLHRVEADGGDGLGLLAAARQPNRPGASCPGGCCLCAGSFASNRVTPPAAAAVAPTVPKKRRREIIEFMAVSFQFEAV